ncbi:MAG TPA: acetyl-CoA carboxylase biotin carboxyl carrier protein [Planctomycetaceae bacterium]|jgi:acetyl-CoA carboxylase biotin carboxyl carrier protein|nr:acetyl-CoA carboxylase biotin carboxyl carrier protein [Planctomycetaceae bacterium]
MPESSGSATPFDLDKLQQLIEMMEKHGVTDVSLRRGNEQWRLRRGTPGTMVAAAPMGYAPAYAPAPAPVAAPAAAPSAAPAASAAVKDDGLLVIKSPTVGTFYSAQAPEDPPFVTVGAKVGPQSTVCLIEAMKVFNPITADVSGTIEAILAKNGDAVEYGQALFKVRP